VPADLDSLLTALYVLVDDLLPDRTGAGRRPKITDAELITLAVAQIFLGCHSERRFLRLARQRLGHLFPYIPKQSGYNKRLRKLAPEICLAINQLAKISPSFCDRLRLLDSTPVPCGTSRETIKRSELAGWAAYGYCADDLPAGEQPRPACPVEHRRGDLSLSLVRRRQTEADGHPVSRSIIWLSKAEMRFETGPDLPGARDSNPSAHPIAPAPNSARSA
jgi:hypothetical protein